MMSPPAIHLMPTLEIFEPDSSPSGIVAGAREQFDRDVAWLRSCGAACRRHHFNRDRGAFESNEVVRQIVADQGDVALPVVLVDGAILSVGAFPNRTVLAHAFGLSSVADDSHTSRLLAAGTALGLALARHDSQGIEAGYGHLKSLGVSRAAFAQSIDELRTSAGSGISDPQISEALDRLAVNGTLRPPQGPCCGG